MVKNFNEVLYDHQTMNTERLVLRRFEKYDAEDVLEYGSNPETLEYLVWTGVSTVEEALSCIVDYMWSRPGIYAIEHKQDHKCIGCIDLRLEPEHQKAGFGYVLNRAYWGKGYMTECLSALLRLCFEELALNRVESNHYEGNPGSGRVMEKCGMKQEGFARQAILVKGILRDVRHYGILRDEWLEQRNSH